MISLLKYWEVEQVVYDTMRSNTTNTMTRNIEQQVSSNIIQKVMDGCYTPVENMINTINTANQQHESLLYGDREELFE